MPFGDCGGSCGDRILAWERFQDKPAGRREPALAGGLPVGRATISGVGLVAQLWQALAVFRVAAVAYAIVLIARDAGSFAHPGYGWLVAAVMVGWTALTVWGFADPARRRWPALVADLLVALGCLAVSGWVMGPQPEADTLPAVWVAAPVFGWAIRGGWPAGAAAAVAVAAADFTIRSDGTGIPQVTISATVLLLFAGVISGYLARLAARAEHQMQQAAQREAVISERERLARGIHDSVLQVLALVQRRGAEIGGEAAELGKLAGEQEATLRALVAGEPAAGSFMAGSSAAGSPLTGSSLAGSSLAGSSLAGPSAARPPVGVPAAGPAVAAAEPVDLRSLLNRFASAGVSIAVPAEPVPLPGQLATELAAAVGAALDNVRIHCGPHASAWLLVEAEPGAVTVTVRDDGPGVPAGRLAQAAADGRLGVAQSIQGRMRAIGGTAVITSTPGEGTEVELRLPVAAVPPPSPG
jgi:signal transduction histidine kinase